MVPAAGWTRFVVALEEQVAVVIVDCERDPGAAVLVCSSSNVTYQAVRIPSLTVLDTLIIQGKWNDGNTRTLGKTLSLTIPDDIGAQTLAVEAIVGAFIHFNLKTPNRIPRPIFRCEVVNQTERTDNNFRDGKGWVEFTGRTKNTEEGVNLLTNMFSKRFPTTTTTTE
jgi:hypothetical protein